VECDIKDCRQSGRVNQLAADKIVTMAKGYITQIIFSTRVITASSNGFKDLKMYLILEFYDLCMMSMYDLFK